MSGILNKKERILDFIITENGRSQIQDNDIRIKYASLSDASINYSKNITLSKNFKSDISDSEFYYLPLENSPKVLSSINPEFSLKKFFSYNYKYVDVLDLNSLSDSQKLNLNSLNDYDLELEKFYQSNSFLSNIKSLKLITTERQLNKDTVFKIESTGQNKESYQFLKTKSYKTIKKLNESIKNIPVVSLDKRFSHKTNNKILIPKDISGNNLYDKSRFKKIDSIVSKINSSGFMFSSYTAASHNDDFIGSREKEISNIIKSLEKDSAIFRKEHKIVNGSNNLTLLFEMNEIEHGDLDTSSISNKILSIEKLHFVKLGEFFLNSTLKKVYLIGKIINSRDINEELDLIFDFLLHYF